LAGHLTAYLYLALLVALALLVGSWMLGTKDELEILGRWLAGGYAPPSETAETLLILVIAAALAALVYAARSLLSFATLYCAFQVLAFFAVRHAHTEIRRAIAASGQELDRDAAKPELADHVALYREALDVLSAYFNERRQIAQSSWSRGGTDRSCTRHLGEGVGAPLRRGRGLLVFHSLDPGQRACCPLVRVIRETGLRPLRVRQGEINTLQFE
jgi:hypothetical protein